MREEKKVTHCKDLSIDTEAACILIKSETSERAEMESKDADGKRRRRIH